MSNDSLIKFAEKLKEARENSKLTIDQIFPKPELTENIFKQLKMEIFPLCRKFISGHLLKNTLRQLN